MEGRRFGLSIGATFLVVAGLLVWRDHPAGGIIAGSFGAVLMLAGSVIPGRLGPVHQAWMELAVAISKVTTPIIMAIIYFGLFTPVGLVRRLVWRSPLVRHPTNVGYWIVRDAEAGRRSDLTRQF